MSKRRFIKYNPGHEGEYGSGFIYEEDSEWPGDFDEIGFVMTGEERFWDSDTPYKVHPLDDLIDLVDAVSDREVDDPWPDGVAHDLWSGLMGTRENAWETAHEHGFKRSTCVADALAHEYARSADDWAQGCQLEESREIIYAVS